MTTNDLQMAIQNAMRAAFPLAEERVAPFFALQEYHLGWRDQHLRPAVSAPGKLLRPQFALLACRAVGGQAEQALPLAAALQLIHDFSLIHDDIQDQSETRRGRETVWKIWGIAHGINVGDGMFTVAHLALHKLSEVGVEPTIVLDVLKRFDQTILTICEGQYLDMSFEGKIEISETDYLAMISRKTAELIAAATGLGAIVGGGNAANVRAMFNFGQSLGLAFQMQDDILGIWGEPEVTGKPYAADVYRRKVSLPIIHALHHSAQRGELERIYRRRRIREADVKRALEILGAAGSRQYVETVAQQYHLEAFQALESVQPGNTALAQGALAQIHALAEGLLGRQT